MTQHLSEEALILHYYGETARADEARVDAHLAECRDCQAAKAQLQRVLTLVETAAPVEARPGFERDVWARLEPQLPPSRSALRWTSDASTTIGWVRSLVRRSLGEGGWALAGGVAALVLVAFMVGRFTGGVPAADLVEATPSLGLPGEASPDRVLQAAMGDHLDRTQMMLTELVNTDVDQADLFAGEQDRASDLVAINRLIRQSAAQSGDAGVVDVLEDLERVLLEIANAPADVTSNELSGLKDRITAQDLLFRVRVIASEMRNRTRTDREAGDRLPQPIS
ncbi:MAG: zf-HC2 domain-containing protein [Acidobacteriota bacterium]|nr:zf-HC2 domain-containing protein [Acidobacteriota bacterium]